MFAQCQISYKPPDADNACGHYSGNYCSSTTCDYLRDVVEFSNSHTTVTISLSYQCDHRNTSFMVQLVVTRLTLHPQAKAHTLRHNLPHNRGWTPVQPPASCYDFVARVLQLHAVVLVLTLYTIKLLRTFAMHQILYSAFHIHGMLLEVRQCYFYKCTLFVKHIFPYSSDL